MPNLSNEGVIFKDLGIAVLFLLNRIGVDEFPSCIRKISTHKCQYRSLPFGRLDLAKGQSIRNYVKYNDTVWLF